MLDELVKEAQRLVEASVNQKLEETILCSLSKLHGSNKHGHGYTKIYNYLFENSQNNLLNILEIGIGTLIPNAPSTMNLDPNSPPTTKPGGSLRMRKDFFRYSDIFGIDIADDCMFTEERIKTFKVNQAKPNELIDFAKSLNLKFDIIIDDGVHLLGPTYITLATLLDFLQPGGIYIIEDIYQGYREAWLDLLQNLSIAWPEEKEKYSTAWIDLRNMTKPCNESQNLLLFYKHHEKIDPIIF
jgi:hypothetical protein